MTTKQILSTTVIAGGAFVIGLSMVNITTSAQENGLKGLFGLDQETRETISENKELFKENRAEVRTAVDSNDYSQLPTEIQTVISQDEFNQIVESKNIKDQLKGFHEEIKTAVDNNDYNSLPDEVKALITNEQFAQMVVHKAEKQAREEVLIKAIEAGDYSQLTDEIKEKIDEEKFDRISQFYNENGELPQKHGNKRPRTNKNSQEASQTRPERR